MHLIKSIVIQENYRRNEMFGFILKKHDYCLVYIWWFIRFERRNNHKIRFLGLIMAEINNNIGRVINIAVFFGVLS